METTGQANQETEGPTVMVESENTGTATGAPSTESTEGAEQQGKTFTQEELNAIIQKRLADEERKVEQRGLMSLTEREAELAQRESDIRRKELKASALDVLLERELPAILGDIIHYTTEEELTQQVDHIEAAFREAVQQGVEARFKQNGYTPRGTSMGYASSDDSDDPFTQGLHSKKL